MKKALTIIIFLLGLNGCSPSPESIQLAISQTQTAVPTPTKVPYSKIPLEDIVFQEGDLPAGYAPGQIRSELGDLTDDITSPDNFISYGMSNNGSFGGLVDVLIYENNKNIKMLYEAVYPNMPGNGDSADVGEEGYASVSVMFVNAVSVTFYRCHALVSMQFQGTFLRENILFYAKRLDNRLKNTFCD